MRKVLYISRVLTRYGFSAYACFEPKSSLLQRIGVFACQQELLLQKRRHPS